MKLLKLKIMTKFRNKSFSEMFAISKNLTEDELKVFLRRYYKRIKPQFSKKEKEIVYYYKF